MKKRQKQSIKNIIWKVMIIIVALSMVGFLIMPYL
jgi:hypothetical protein